MGAGDDYRGPVGWPPPTPDYIDAPRRRGGARARVVPGGGPGALPGSPPPALGAAGSLVLFPPDFFPPDGATDFQLNGNAAGLVIASGEVTLATFTLPASDRGVIRSVVVGVNDYTAVGSVRFRVLVAGAAVAGWDNIIVPPQAAAFCSFSYGPEETRIWVAPGKQVQLRVQVLAGGPFGASAVAHGWHWSDET